VIPEEEAIPAALLGLMRQIGQQPRIASRAKVGDIDAEPKESPSLPL